MALIRIDYDGLETQSRNLNTIKENYAELSGRLNALISQINDSWEGNAGEAYHDKMVGYYTKSLKMSALFEQFNNYINMVTTKFRTTDDKCADLINRSF